MRPMANETVEPVPPRSAFRRRPIKAPKPKNALEAMSQRKVPDVILGLLLALLCAFTLIPYLGGRELWMLGTNTVKLPTISSFALWLSVVTTPYLWLFATTRMIGAPVHRILIEVSKATLLLVLVVFLHIVYPAFGLTASDPTNLLNKEIDARGLSISRGAIGYSFFRTGAIPLDTGDSECVLRFENARITANARAATAQGISAYDIQLFGSTHPLLDATFTYLETPPWRRVSSRQMLEENSMLTLIEEPPSNQIAGRAVLRVNSTVSKAGDFPLDITFNFKTLETDVKPEVHVQKEVSQTDLVVTPRARGFVQLVGWTLWGEGEVALIIDQPKIKIDGKRFCPPLVGSMQALKAKAIRALTY